MIQFSLKCDMDHRFDSWFQSADAFDTLHGKGLVTCAVCGSSAVDKAMMAPRVSKGQARPLSTPATAAEQALADLRRRIEAESDYVGSDFAREARRIHEGKAEARSIHGEARALIEDGVSVVPLPFLMTRKAH